jgi:hypothetical protein
MNMAPTIVQRHAGESRASLAFSAGATALGATDRDDLVRRADGHAAARLRLHRDAACAAIPGTRRLCYTGVITNSVHKQL